MALRIRTVMTYPLDGSTEFIIPFEYLARKFVTVTLVGQDRRELVLNQDYRFVEKTKIQTSRTWTGNDGYTLIEIRRYTSATERLVDFADGSILRAYDLNISQVQTLHVAEEARDLTADTIGVNNDGHLDARGRRIVNVADAVDEYDAVNLRTIKNWNDGAYQSYIKAQQEATRAQQEADRAKNAEAVAYQHSENSKGWGLRSETAATRSEQARDRALQSENSSAGSASAANASAHAAKTSENNANAHANRSNAEANRSKTEADRAKTEADKLGNMNNLAATISFIDENNVFWKGKHTVTEIRSNTTYVFDPTDTYAFSWSFNGGTLNFNRKNFTNLNWAHTQHYNVHMRGDTAVKEGSLYVEGGNTGVQSLVATTGDPGDGNWVARSLYKWYSSSAEFGIVRGGGTDIQRVQLSLNNPGGQGSPTWDFRANGWLYSPGPIVVGGNGTFTANGDISGTLWGGYLSNWVNNELSSRSNEINNRVHDMRRGNIQEHFSNGNADWESPWGYFTGYRNKTGDGNIKFTTWICRLPQMYKNSTGWVDIGNW